MIASIFHKGSGLGNQLHSYVMTRVLAKSKGVDFGMIYPENFKGHSFMELDMGKPVSGLQWQYFEKEEKNEFGHDVRDYDTDVYAVKDNTCIDGYWQGEKYYEHLLEEINEWFKVDPIEMPDDVCAIGFRAGEYVGVKDLFLPMGWWIEAISFMRSRYPDIRFEVHTDDIETAKAFFPDFPIIQDIGINWRSIRHAKHLIISNSSFYIFPALLGEAKEIIAPEFWAGHNKGYWQQKQNVYKRFTYL